MSKPLICGLFAQDALSAIDGFAYGWFVQAFALREVILPSLSSTRHGLAAFRISWVGRAVAWAQCLSLFYF